MIEHAFVISMDTSTGRERLGKLRRRMTTAAPGVTMDVVKGIDGGEVRDSADVSPACKLFCTGGMIGVELSHIACWQQVVDRNLEHALILEDDAVFVDDFESKMQRALTNVPSDYHVLILGCWACSPGVQKLFGISEDPNDIGVRKVTYFNGTHAYIVSQKGARYLLRATRKQAMYHTDIHMSFVSGLKKYAVTQDLSFQEDMTTSSIAASSHGATFPGTLNVLLGKITTSKNVSWVYFANVPAFQLGPIVVTLWTFFFFFLGLSRKVPWVWMLLFTLGDVILVSPGSILDLSLKLGVFAFGSYVRHRFFLFEW